MRKIKRRFKKKKKRKRKLKALDAIIVEGSSIVASKEDLDKIFFGTNALEKLKDQNRFRSLVRAEKITLKGNKNMLYRLLLHHIAGSDTLVNKVLQFEYSGEIN